MALRINIADSRMINRYRAAFSFLLFLFILTGFFSCSKEINNDDPTLYPEKDRFIRINDKISIDNGVHIKNPLFNILKYDGFLKYLSGSDHFQIVQLKDFKNAHSDDKVIIALRYDIDENIQAAVKLAYREHKYGIKSTYFVLHTADYYLKRPRDVTNRNDDVIYYLKKIQDDFGHEIGFHNDLVTMQVVYGVDSKEYLKKELAFLRGNNINIVGTSYHGSEFCYIYHYYNAYFWEEYPKGGWNYEYVSKGYKAIKIEKDILENYGLQYEGGLLGEDYFFADCNFVNGKRWNMNMVNLDTIKPGKKVIILFHPANWD